MENKYMDVKMVSEYLHVSVSLIYHMVSKEQIPFVKVGSRTIFERNIVDHWMANGCRKTEDLPQLPKI
jgi:excisionase family DNA binding protein